MKEVKKDKIRFSPTKAREEKEKKKKRRKLWKKKIKSKPSRAHASPTEVKEEEKKGEHACLTKHILVHLMLKKREGEKKETRWA
jgi:hypothetical protein